MPVENTNTISPTKPIRPHLFYCDARASAFIYSTSSPNENTNLRETPFPFPSKRLPRRLVWTSLRDRRLKEKEMEF